MHGGGHRSRQNIRSLRLDKCKSCVLAEYALMSACQGRATGLILESPHRIRQASEGRTHFFGFEKASGDVLRYRKNGTDVEGRSGRPPCAKRVRGNQNEIRTVMQGVVEHGFQGQGLSNPSSTSWDIRCPGGGFCPVLGPAWIPTSDLEKSVEFGSKRLFKVPIHVRLRCFALWGSRAF